MFFPQIVRRKARHKASTHRLAELDDRLLRHTNFDTAFWVMRRCPFLGFAVDDEETLAWVQCVAAPVRAAPGCSLSGASVLAHARISGLAQDARATVEKISSELVLLCYKILKPLRIDSTAGYPEGDGCCSSEDDPDGRGRLSADPDGRDEQASGASEPPIYGRDRW